MALTLHLEPAEGARGFELENAEGRVPAPCAFRTLVEGLDAAAALRLRSKQRATAAVLEQALA